MHGLFLVYCPSKDIALTKQKAIKKVMAEGLEFNERQVLRLGEMVQEVKPSMRNEKQNDVLKMRTAVLIKLNRLFHKLLNAMFGADVPVPIIQIGDDLIAEFHALQSVETGAEDSMSVSVIGLNALHKMDDALVPDAENFEDDGGDMEVAVPSAKRVREAEDDEVSALQTEDDMTTYAVYKPTKWANRYLADLLKAGDRIEVKRNISEFEYMIIEMKKMLDALK